MKSDSLKQTKQILIIDDHRVVTEGLVLLLKKEEELEVCGCAASCQEALDAIHKNEPDIALVDLSLGDRDGLELIQELSKSHPKIRCIVLSTKDENVYAGRCIRAGAKGYLMKDQPFKVIIDAIKDVLKGKLFFSENVMQQLLQHNMFGGKSNTTDVDLLSNREFEIFRLIGEGLRQRQIAEKLYISTATVNTHCQKIKSKLQLESMDELVDRAIAWFQSK